MSEKPTFRIRFNLNQRTGAAENSRNVHRAGQQFTSVIIREVGLEASERAYRKLTKTIRSELRQDIEQEIENIARFYTQIVIGRSGVRNRSHTITAQTTETQGAIVFGPWKPLSENTIKRKGHSNFFRDRRGLAAQVNRGAFWTENFGPINIRIDRIRSEGPLGVRPYASGFSGKDAVHFSVARIKVSALGKITSAMVPELATGRLGYGGYNGRETGLMDLIGDQETRLKLANWGRDKKGAYRPSLEPFLGFVLTRAIPQAVFRRIKDRRGNYPGGVREIRK